MKFNYLIYIAFLFLLSSVAPAGEKPELAGLSFDGKDDIVLVPLNGDFHPDAVTVEAWVKVNAFESLKGGGNKVWQCILFKKNVLKQNSEGFLLYFNEQTKQFIAMVSSDKGKQVCVLSQKNLIEPGRWYHLAMTADSKELALYVDGSLQGKMPTKFRLTFDKTPLIIGARDKESNKMVYDGKYNGIVDEISIWGYVKTRAEIISAMDTPLTGRERSLLVYLPFSEGKGTVTYDIGPTKYIGALVNGPTWVKPDEKEEQEAMAGVIDVVVSVTPNPLKNKGKFNISLPMPFDVDINIYKLSGETAKELFKGNLQQGSHSLDLELNDAEFPNGTYICKINYGNFSKIVQIIKQN